MNQPVRIAIVGAGLITQGSHLPAVLSSAVCRLAAVVDPVVERADALVRSYGSNARVASRIEDVLGIVDGAIIATPNGTHREIALTCLRAGVSVLIEKPLASTVADGEEIVRVGKAESKVVATGYSTRFRENVQLLWELIQENRFGRVRRFVHQFGTAGGWAPLSGYNLRRDSAGGGVLVVTGTHFIDRMIHFWGMPEDAWLEDDSLGGPEANCRAHFRFNGGGLEGMAVYSKTARLPAGLAIDTEQGTVLLRDTDDAEIVLRPRDRPMLEQVIRRRPEPGGASRVSEFVLQVDNFGRACRGEGEPLVDGEQGLRSLRLIERLYADRRGNGYRWYGLGEVKSA